MQKYLNNFIENGFDDIKIIIEQAQKGIYIKDSELKEAGILIPGDRAKILIRIQEKAGNFKFAVPKSVYYTCRNINKVNNDINIKNFKNWLKNLRIDNYLKNFINNGYHSIELLFLQMESQSPLTAEILKEEMGIDKIGHRSRIINKLKEDGRSYINKLKTSILLVGNANNNKFCDCFLIQYQESINIQINLNVSNLFFMSLIIHFINIRNAISKFKYKNNLFIYIFILKNY